MTFWKHAAPPFVKSLLFRSAAGISIAVAINDCLFDLHSVTGQSMAPTLSPNYYETGQRDIIVFSTWNPALKLRRGDVVSYWKPHNPEELGVKRVIALPGDTVFTRHEWQRGRGDHKGWGREAYPWQKVVVPWGHVWVEGDNWRETVDSNDFGPVSSR